MISVLILTKNEQQDLPGCLASVSWSDDLHVFDSFSTDGTIDVAHEVGAKVTQRVFDGYASQRNAGLHELNFKYPWVLILDADERIPVLLKDEIAQFVAEMPLSVVAGRIRRRDYFFGTWLKHAQISPFYVRLVRPNKVHYEREVNEVLVANGDIADLHQPFDHFPFSKGIEHWVSKHNVYSTMEAKLITQTGDGEFSIRKAFFANDFNERRFHQKALFYRLPFRPLIKWLYMMFVRGAVLDGKAGITYSFLQAIYEYMIVLKTRELRASAHRGVK